jgi:hypothetical protein
MLRRTVSLASIAFVVSVLTSTSAVASAQRTFVASYGSPANTAFNCSIANPCRAFSEAMSVTSVNGEVIVLDSAGYGAVTITQSVSIIAPPGIYGGISVFSGTGITVNGSNIKVVLRGLTINGQGGLSGIAFAQGAKLTIEDCEIANMPGSGIIANAPNSIVTVKNTVIRDNGGNGVGTAAGSRVTIADSVLANNGLAGVSAGASAGFVTDVMVTRSIIDWSPIGLQVGSGTGGTARLVSDGNVINNAATVAFDFQGGLGIELIYTSGNNTVGFNNAIVSGGALTPIGMH